MGWVKQLNEDPKLQGKVDWVKVEEAHKQWDYKQQGLTPEGAAIVTLVAAYFAVGPAGAAGNTAGNAAAIGLGEGVPLAGGGAFLTGTGATVSTVVSSAVTAGLSALAGQVAVATINNRGDLAATLHELGSSANVKNLLTAIATGGVLGGLNLNPTGGPTVGSGTQGFLNQLGQNVQAGVAKALIGTAINGGSLEDNLKDGLKAALIDTFAAQGANAIGDWKNAGVLDGFTNKIAHAIAGCLVGAAKADSTGGCSAGALGAAMGEVAAEAYGWHEDTVQLAAFLGGLAVATIGGDAAQIDLAGQAAGNAAANNHGAHAGWGYEYPDIDHPFAPTEEFKTRFFGTDEERKVWFRTQEIAASTAQSREWLKFDDPKVQLPRSGGAMYQIFDLGEGSAGSVRIAYSPKFPNIFYVSLDHYKATTAQRLRWTRFEASMKK
ncbi:DUF637 domain-containing protein [Variovorax sp. UMC13]|uniref:DUF637 domain-containing protein n=1 Tax=Variovorax sp. UMC13 TaxID=1862326 RepID=UPI0021804E71|nr:DUF637 domain-containing protein [Variovorax sp. UMC13]